MKAGVAAMVHAIVALRDLGYVPGGGGVTICTIIKEECTGNGTLALLPVLNPFSMAPGDNNVGGGTGRMVVIILEPFPWIVTAKLGVLFHHYRDQEAVPRPFDIKCPTDAQFYSSLFQDPSRVVVTCYGLEALLLDYVGGLLSKMYNKSFLLSCGSGGGGDGGIGNREVGDGGEDGGGVEQGLVVAGGQDPLQQGVPRVAILVVVLVDDGGRCRQGQCLSQPRRRFVTPLPDTWHITMTTVMMRMTMAVQRHQRPASAASKGGGGAAAMT